MTKPVWSHVLAFKCLDFVQKAHIVSCQKTSALITNICMQDILLTN